MNSAFLTFCGVIGLGMMLGSLITESWVPILGWTLSLGLFLGLVNVVRGR